MGISALVDGFVTAMTAAVMKATATTTRTTTKPTATLLLCALLLLVVLGGAVVPRSKTLRRLRVSCFLGPEPDGRRAIVRLASRKWCAGVANPSPPHHPTSNRKHFVDHQRTASFVLVSRILHDQPSRLVISTSGFPALVPFPLPSLKNTPSLPINPWVLLRVCISSICVVFFHRP